MEDGKDAAVTGWVEEFVAVPAGGEWAGLGLAVADDAGNDQVRVVERRPIGMTESATEFSAFVDAARSFGGDVAGNSAGEAELLEQFFHPLHILADVRIH